VAKLVWQVKLAAELEPGVVTETELARIERDEQAGLAELGLRLDEAKRLTAALQAQLVPAQVAALGARRRSCEACGRVLASKGHHGATFHSLFGDVPVRVRRRLACPCQGADEAKSCTVLDLGKDALAPELAYVTARYAAMGPFGKVAALLSELLPLGGGQHASTVRNRTLRVGAQVVQAQRPSRTWGALRCWAKRPAGPLLGGDMVLGKGAIRNGSSDLQHPMRPPRRPAHLLVGTHPAVQQPLHRALCGRRRDRLAAAPRLRVSMIRLACPET